MTRPVFSGGVGTVDPVGLDEGNRIKQGESIAAYVHSKVGLREEEGEKLSTGHLIKPTCRADGTGQRK